MEKRYRNSYTIETESILSESLKFFPPNLREVFSESFPMMVLRNCSKMFFLNEIEACQLIILIKEIGWAPSEHIPKFISKFNPPSCFLESNFNEKIVVANPIIVNVMIMCCTAKKLLNDRHVSLIIMNYIEQRCFEDFGKLFNVWIKNFEPFCKINMKKINKLYTNVLRTPKTYSFPHSNIKRMPEILDKRLNFDLALIYSADESKGGTRKSSISSFDPYGSIDGYNGDYEMPHFSSILYIMAEHESQSSNIIINDQYSLTRFSNYR